MRFLQVDRIENNTLRFTAVVIEQHIITSPQFTKGVRLVIHTHVLMCSSVFLCGNRGNLSSKSRFAIIGETYSSFPPGFPGENALRPSGLSPATFSFFCCWYCYLSCSGSCELLSSTCYVHWYCRTPSSTRLSPYAFLYSAYSIPPRVNFAWSGNKDQASSYTDFLRNGCATQTGFKHWYHGEESVAECDWGLSMYSRYSFRQRKNLTF